MAEKVSINLPEGMTLEEFNKAFAAFQKARISGQQRDKAKKAAINDLIAAHKEEYDKLLKKYMPK